MQLSMGTRPTVGALEMLLEVLKCNPMENFPDEPLKLPKLV